MLYRNAVDLELPITKAE